MIFYRDFPDQDAGSLRCKELPCAVQDYQVLGESQTLENWGQLPHLRTLPPTSSSLPDFRSKTSWDTSKGKKQQRSLSCRGGNKETSETEPKTNPHFISKCQAPCSHSLCAGGRREEQEQCSYREMRTAEVQNSPGDSRPDLWQAMIQREILPFQFPAQGLSQLPAASQDKLRAGTCSQNSSAPVSVSAQNSNSVQESQKTNLKLH